MSRIRPRSVYDVLALVSFFLVLGGGTALASYVVSSNSQVAGGTISGHRPPAGKHANIISGSVNATDLATGAVGPAKLANGAVSTSKLANSAVTSPKVADNSLTGANINESTLGLVPSATHANSADNAQNLGGQPASDYRLHCPGVLDRAGDLCFEPDTRPAATYTAALKACAIDQRRLPDAGELALAFDHLSAVQPQQWTASHLVQPTISAAADLGQSASRDLSPGSAPMSSPIPFRCVTSATN